VSYQRCLRCGTDEWSGAYCTHCRTAEYDLIEHRHYGVGQGNARACPLGPVENPGPARRSQRSLAVNRRFLADPIPPAAETYVIRRWTHRPPRQNGSGRPRRSEVAPEAA
jgi:hypothetical protein